MWARMDRLSRQSRKKSASKTGINSNQVLRCNRDNYHKGEANAALQVIKYIRDHPVANFGFLSIVASATLVYICQQYWSESHQFSVYESRRYLRETAIYQKLIDGPSFDNKDRIPRKVLQDKVRSPFTPSSTGRFYPLVIGQYGVGKTTLIQLAVNALPTPKGVIYFDVPGRRKPRASHSGTAKVNRMVCGPHT